MNIHETNLHRAFVKDVVDSLQQLLETKHLYQAVTLSLKMQIKSQTLRRRWKAKVFHHLCSAGRLLINYLPKNARIVQSLLVESKS